MELELAAVGSGFELLIGFAEMFNLRPIVAVVHVAFGGLTLPVGKSARACDRMCDLINCVSSCLFGAILSIAAAVVFTYIPASCLVGATFVAIFLPNAFRYKNSFANWTSQFFGQRFGFKCSVIFCAFTSTFAVRLFCACGATIFLIRLSEAKNFSADCALAKEQFCFGFLLLLVTLNVGARNALPVHIDKTFGRTTFLPVIFLLEFFLTHGADHDDGSLRKGRDIEPLPRELFEFQIQLSFTFGEVALPRNPRHSPMRMSFGASMFFLSWAR